jgi:hypothetical protein
MLRILRPFAERGKVDFVAVWYQNSFGPFLFYFAKEFAAPLYDRKTEKPDFPLNPCMRCFLTTRRDFCARVICLAKFSGFWSQLLSQERMVFSLFSFCVCVCVFARRDCSAIRKTDRPKWSLSQNAPKVLLLGRSGMVSFLFFRAKSLGVDLENEPKRNKTHGSPLLERGKTCDA